VRVDEIALPPIASEAPLLSGPHFPRYSRGSEASVRARRAIERRTPTTLPRARGYRGTSAVTTLRLEGRPVAVLLTQENREQNRSVSVILN